MFAGIGLLVLRVQARGAERRNLPKLLTVFRIRYHWISSEDNLIHNFHFNVIFQCTVNSTTGPFFFYRV